MLEQGAISLDAVEKAIVTLEDAEPLNAGYGSNLSETGKVECDAAIMDGLQNFGSVGALSGIPNPITVARAILNHSLIDDPLGRIPPMTLVGKGAYDFAVARKLATVDPEMLVSPRAERDWSYWKGRINQSLCENEQILASLVHDTVGAVALDRKGHVAAGVSSGGILHKIAGRLGEASVFGAGCWADNVRRIACSVTGTGEAIIRLNLARKLCETLDSADEPEEALVQIFDEELAGACSKINCSTSAGAVLLSREPDEVVRLWCIFNAPSMAIGYISSENPRPQSVILRQESRYGPINDKEGKPSCFLTVIPWCKM